MAGSVMSGRADLDLVWVLAVDFGTTATAAAVREPDGRVAGLVLPDGTSTMPSSVLADPNGVLVGTKADSAAGYSLDRYQPTPKRDIGRASVLLGDAEFRPCTLIAAVYAAIIREAVRQHNHRPPEQLVLTHPVDWSDRRLDVLREAVSMAADQLEISLPDPTFMPEPVAAATHYAQASDQPTARITTTSAGSAVVPSEDVVGDEYFAVYDLGGGTFDVTVLCRSSDGFEILATGGIDPLGGFEFDNRLFNYLGQTHYKKADPKLWQALDYPDPEDPDSGMRRRMLDTTVRQVKEELSEHTQRTVRLPGLPEPVLVTRTEFENLIRTDLDATIAEFEATLARAGLTPDQLAGIYRIGGASRIPLVGSLLDQIERPVHVVDHPKTVVALGAVVDAAESVEPAVVDELPTGAQPEGQTELLATVPVSAEGAASVSPRQRLADEVTALHQSEKTRTGPSKKVLAVIGGIAAAVVVAVVVLVVMLSSKPDSGVSGPIGQPPAARPTGSSELPPPTGSSDVPSPTASTNPGSTDSGPDQLIRTLNAAGIDTTLPRGNDDLREYLANSEFTPYPAVAQALLDVIGTQRLRQPVAIDAIVSSYEVLAGAPPPNRADLIDVGVLKKAVVEEYISRYGGQVADFESLLVGR
ncbi:Hsp70 family protein [Mycobacterium sp. AZCC_0083]|uniref:Hsp70 family protein n=1 Tax=Mycobacterium sp. AZCC_0083 TaxID=2735882 RepID=UPI002104712D|nr:Hsp70 family protein [Mycobacterium sp. AZCC_0083]